MVSKTIRYKDNFGNKVSLEREDDDDFNLRIKFEDDSESTTLITKQDFKRMKYLEALLEVDE